MVMARDVVITRKQPRKLRLATTHREPESRESKGFSRHSRSRALRHLRNATQYRTFAVLTFPEPVSDDRNVKAAIERLARRMARLGVSFFWKQEFYLSGRPHIHLLLTSDMDEATLSQAWSAAIERSSVRVYCEPIRSYQGSTCYLMKACDHPQHQVPEGYRNMGRYWGTRGPKAQAETLFVARGDAATLATLVRPVRGLERAEKRKQGRKPRRDNGVAGKTFYDCGGNAVAKALKTLSLNVENRTVRADPPPVPLHTPRPTHTERPSQFLLLAGILVLARPKGAEQISATSLVARSGA